MPFLALLIVALQIAFAVHAVRTGKETFWLWLILMAPGIGCAIYFLTQIAPVAASSRAARNARKRLVRAVDPQRELRIRMESLEAANTVENRLALADECLEAGLASEAITLLNESLVGMHKTDPSIMERLARAQFDSGDSVRAIQTLDSLIELNPTYKSLEGHLLYARALAAAGRTQDAVEEYEALRSTYTGEEARVRYAQLLKSMGQSQKAAELFEEALTHARRAPRHYRSKQKEWLRIAQRG